MSAALDVASPKADEMVGSSPSESSPMPSPQGAIGAELVIGVTGVVDTLIEAEEVLPFESGSDAGLPDDEVPAIEARKLTVPRKVKDATKEQAKPQVKEQQEEINAMSHLSEEEQMKLLLGIGGFDSTKGKAVEENLKSAATGTARRETKREYRQYMNRRGGFNRPLDMS
ncbi:hypothetical protein PInf_010087 [Phytophthora infestans]|nr:hypothetical protein PInf_010087 [Phytophthora infestans]